MTSKRCLKILVAPLDWGLGHTTRCVPLIRYMLQQGHHITLAGNEWQRQYITETFPGIDTIHLDGYEVNYSKSRSGFMFSILAQAPRLLRTVRKEHDWLLKLTEKQHFDAILSDNRYGLYHPAIPSVIMTHQLLAQTELGGRLDELLRKFHYRLLQRYTKCWVVDVVGLPNLSGKLGHPKLLPINASYLGLLSQITPPQQTKEDHLLVLLSGPEPQRTILSDMLWKQVQQYDGKVVFVEGAKGVDKRGNIPAHISYHTRITKDTLQPLIENASMVVCRSGYSTLMDLAVLKKKAILIPTPGQTEQEFLGRHLHKEGVFYSTPQKGFDLQQALGEAYNFPFRGLAMEQAFGVHKSVLDGWLENLSSKK